jgi:hypothetical protein
LSSACIADRAAATSTGEVVRYLAAGEVVSIVVDSEVGSGELELDIQPRAGACPEAGVLPVSFDDPQGELSIAHLTERTLAPSCGQLRLFDQASDSYQEMGDTSYTLTTLPDPGSFSVTCGVVASSQQPFVLYALAGADCGGEEVACVRSTVDSNGLYNAAIGLPGDKDVGVPYTVVVAAESLTRDSVTLRSSCTRIATAQ